MIHSLEIEKFRLFKNDTLNLGKRITVIAGHNASGKSTVLGLLGNMVETKQRNIFGKQYRTDFSEIIKSSVVFDKTGEHKGTMNFCDKSDFLTINYTAQFRSTWQANNRFRIIPKRINENGIETAAKYPLPVIYLGLSRLYPLGETGDEISPGELSLTNDEIIELYQNYRYILSLPEDIENFSTMNVKNMKLNFTGIETKTYDKLCNSAGQDNLGQILLALISFERLYQDSKVWDGGLLLIDEIDTTFHPSAQLRLLDLIFKKSKKIDLQIVFTTHSTTILHHIADKYASNKSFTNDYKLQLISRANGPLKIYENPSKELIDNNLNVTTSDIKQEPKIIVYSEDDTTRWLFKKLIYGYNNKLRPLNIDLGCSQLSKLLKQDSRYFSTVLFVVDGDVKKSDPQFVKKDNVLALVGEQGPEKVIFDYLENPDCKYWDRISEETGFTRRYIIDDYGPLSHEYESVSKEKDKLHRWFYDNKKKIVENKVFEHWKKDNKELYDSFRKEFIEKFNKLALIQGIDLIKKK